ncbi:hypothetical protein G6M85_22540 [Agrobacterium tumefaciens]|uniref:hypothetical protein n=1 Tax=Agrobacterium tumefaciens TaxID=358 RepID=UPI001574617E|nr:hypothetical protein [Agrobacterium tumefaciens]NTE68376.1 hypothetical protein [Agrobacterium tumefaciens]
MSSDWEFKQGMRVVCVDDDYDTRSLCVAREFCIQLPKKGCVYTLRDVFDVPEYGEDADNRLRVLLLEISNSKIPFISGDVEADFPARRFRPLDESRLDVFRDLLVDLPKEEELV